ncbi:hypothetical protein KSF73_12175 [Burkholderiaceae bacterium DAT-1]|nr:hypothetical protein [Burkholderiaceae bacterium DAT-1]
MSIKAIQVGALALAALAGSAYADNSMVAQRKDVGLGVQASYGVDGAGVSIAADYLLIFPNTTVRLGFNDGGISHNVSTTGMKYDGNYTARDVSLLVDWAPNGGFFRVTGGLLSGTNRISLKGVSDGNKYQLGHNTYAADQVYSIDGEVTAANKIKPYIGVGWGKLTGSDSGLFIDAGLTLSNKLNSTVTAVCGASMFDSYCARLKADALVEQSKLNDSVKFLKAVPTIKIGYVWGF